MTPFLILAIPAVLRRWREPPRILLPRLAGSGVARVRSRGNEAAALHAAALSGAGAADRRGPCPRRALASLPAAAPRGVLLVLLPLGAAVGVSSCRRFSAIEWRRWRRDDVQARRSSRSSPGSASWRGRFDRAVLGAAASGRGTALSPARSRWRCRGSQSLWLARGSSRLPRHRPDAATRSSRPRLERAEPRFLMPATFGPASSRPAAAAAWLREPGCRVAAIADSSSRLRRAARWRRQARPERGRDAKRLQLLARPAGDDAPLRRRTGAMDLDGAPSRRRRVPDRPMRSATSSSPICRRMTGPSVHLRTVRD